MRPETPNPLTLEEHRQLGSELRATNVRLRQLRDLVVSVYGPNTRASFSFNKLTEAIDRLCAEMETQATRDAAGFKSDNLYL